MIGRLATLVRAAGIGGLRENNCSDDGATWRAGSSSAIASARCAASGARSSSRARKWTCDSRPAIALERACECSVALPLEAACACSSAYGSSSEEPSSNVQCITLKNGLFACTVATQHLREGIQTVSPGLSFGSSSRGGSGGGGEGLVADDSSVGDVHHLIVV